MALIQKFKINGQDITGFVDWQDAEFVCSRNDAQTELNITATNIEFVKNGAKIIRDYVAGGINGTTNGFFEGPKFEMIIQDQNNTLTAFMGCLDFVQQYEEISPVRVRCALARVQEKKSIEERSKVITAALLHDEGIITANDYSTIPYVVEKEFDPLALLMLSITTYLMLKELAEAVRKLAEDIGEIAATAAGGVTGAAAAIALGVIKAALNLAYSILLILYIIDLVNDIIEYLISPVRDWKGIKFKTLLEKFAQYGGYTYNSTVEELNDLYLLPSKMLPATLSQQVINLVSGQGNNGFIDDGIPNSGDIGHTWNECLELHSQLFESRLHVDFNTGTQMNQEPLVNDTFWDADAQVDLPNTLNESVSYNGNELIGRYLIRFERDERDRWTDSDDLGRIYEVVTYPKTVSDEKCVRIQGFKEVRPGVALGSRKDGLNAVESAVKSLASLADSVVNFFGGNSNLAGRIQNRVGLLRVSEQTTGIAKMLYLKQQNGVLKLPSDHKDKFSSKTLWEKYHVENSFVLTVNEVQNRGQKQRFAEEPLLIPLGFQQFVKLINKTRINLTDGSKGNITELLYKPAKDKAKINGWKRKVYSKNLQHNYFNSDNPNL